MTQRFGGGNLNESVAERPTEPWLADVRTGLIYLSENWLGTSSSALTAAAVSPQSPVETPPNPRRSRRWLLDTGLALDLLAGGTSYAAGSYGLRTPVREAFDLDVVTAGGASPSLLRQREPNLFELTSRREILFSERGISRSALYDQRESNLVPYLALVRSALERDDLSTARKTLDAVPLDVADQPEVRRLKKLLSPPRITVSRTRDADRTLEYRWFRDNWQDYRAQWVALDGDTVVAAAASLKELREILKRMNPLRPPLVHRVD